VGLGKIHRHHHALAGGKAVGLDHDRRALGIDVGMGGLDLGEGLELRGRDLVSRHEALGKVLGAFQLRGGFCRSEDAQVAGTEHVDDAGRQRRFGTDHGGMHLLPLGVIGQGMDVGQRQVLKFLFACRTGIARRHVNLLQARRLRQAPGQRMLAPAGTHHKNLHGASAGPPQGGAAKQNGAKRTVVAPFPGKGVGGGMFSSQ
jgi:hypothetical protein